MISRRILSVMAILLLTAGMIMRSSQRLAINGDRFPTQRKLKVLNRFA